jgi:drug/metabolite transporter (DMT)-like permease
LAVVKFMDHVARWPLLLGAIICIAGALGIALEAGEGEIAVGVLLALGALMLGAWLWALATNTNPEHRAGQASAPPATGETQGGAEGLDGDYR